MLTEPTERQALAGRCLDAANDASRLADSLHALRPLLGLEGRAACTMWMALCEDAGDELRKMARDVQA